LVMDFIPGEDLGTIVKREGIQPNEKVIYWAKQLGKALSYLHSQEPPVIHRDIKPGNIKITPRGEVILVDFGIAKSAEQTQETSTGAKGLTPGYSPPEQYGSGRTGHYSDQFGFAATLYNLLTNEKPVDAVERLLGQATLTPIHTLNPNVPPHIEQAIERAMSIKPEDRYPSVQDFVQDLAQSSASKTDETLVGFSKPTQPVKPPASSESTRISSTPPPLAGAGKPPAYVPPVQPISQPQPKKKRGFVWLIPVVLLLGIGLLGGGWFLFKSILSKLATPAPATMVVGSITETSALDIIATEKPTDLPVVDVLPTETAVLTEEPTAEPTEIPTAVPTAVPTVALPSIGRDGLVAYVSNAGDGETFQIWTMKVFQKEDGTLVAGEQKQLTFDAGSKYYPNWSPDGSQIIFSADTLDPVNKIDLYTIEPDGSNLSNVITIPGNQTEAAWSPDGQWIAFTTDNRSDGIKQLMVVRPDGSELTRISGDKQEFSPEWSPMMDRLVFVMPSASLRYLWMRDPANDFADLERDMFYMRITFIGDPAWSPDGAWMAYTNVQGRTQDIFLTRVKSFGLEVKRLTTTTFDLYPAWSPDSTWILFESNRDGNLEIYIMDIDGKNQTNLTQSPGSAEMQPAWQMKP
jgi:serine/threonine protein kinase